MKRLFILVGCVIMLAGSILACGASDNSSNTGTAIGAGTSVPTSAPAKHFTVGQTVKVGDTWQVTINGAKTSQGDDFTKPKSGNVFVIVDVTLKNISNKEDNVSSALNFSIKDSTGQKYDETILSGDTPPDGKVAASDNLRGQLVYEVPTAQHKLTFSFEPDIISSGQTLWDISI